MHVKTLDFSKFQGSESARLEFSRELLEGFKNEGFVKLINHGFDEEAINQLFKWDARFFELPKEEKQRIINIDGPKPQRGWCSFGAEKTGTLNQPGKINLNRVAHVDREDLKEHFDMGPTTDEEFPNLWPSESAISGFREWMERYFQEAEKVTMDLLLALEMAMGAPLGSLCRRCTNPASELRLNHYPATRASKLADGGNAQRIWPHTDFGVLTLLAQDARGGLEIEDTTRPGTFQPVPLVEKTELVVNIGDMLERWTNGALRAGLHRVTAPKSSLENRDPNALLPARFSVAFFLKASRDSSAGPISYFVDSDRPRMYEELTAIEYQRLRTNVVY